MLKLKKWDSKPQLKKSSALSCVAKKSSPENAAKLEYQPQVLTPQESETKNAVEEKAPLQKN